MKKSLVLAMAMALGVTASAYAANPFSDVPAGHWAYDSVAKLAAAGVVDGYVDGTYGGDKLITRYEMAQIVAKAMAKGANVDKLAAEFADELDTLGVRVANLEKKADNVKISGQIRARYHSHENDTDTLDLRTRLWVQGQVNEDWTYTALLQNVQTIAGDESTSNLNGGDDNLDLNRAYLNGRVGGLAVQAGRWDEVTSSGAVLDSYMDGVKVAYGDKVKVWGLAAKGSDDDLTEEAADRVYAAGIETKIGVIDTYVNYFKADDVVTPAVEEKEIYDIGLALNVAKDTQLTYEYMWGDEEYTDGVSKDGYIVGLNYKGATEEVGSYGLHAYWYDQPVNCWLNPTFDLTNFKEHGGYEGWSVGVDYALAKNILLCVNYYDTESKLDNEDDQSIYTEVYFNF